MYIEWWLVVLLGTVILGLMNKVSQLKRQITSLYGSLWVADRVTNFTERLNLFQTGLESSSENDEDLKGVVKLNRALLIVDSDELRQALTTLESFMNQEQDEDKGIVYFNLPSREWWELLLADKENAYVVIRNYYGNSALVQGEKANDRLNGGEEEDN